MYLISSTVLFVLTFRGKKGPRGEKRRRGRRVHKLTNFMTGLICLSWNWRETREEMKGNLFSRHLLSFLCARNKTRKNFNRIFLPSSDNVFNISEKTHKISCMHAMLFSSLHSCLLLSSLLSFAFSSHILFFYVRKGPSVMSSRVWQG